MILLKPTLLLLDFGKDYPSPVLSNSGYSGEGRNIPYTGEGTFLLRM